MENVPRAAGKKLWLCCYCYIMASFVMAFQDFSGWQAFFSEGLQNQAFLTFHHERLIWSLLATEGGEK